MTATRLYLPSSGSAAVSPAFDAFWDRTTTVDVRPCSTSKANTSNVAKNPGSETFGVVADILAVQFVSAQQIPANATIGTGTVSAVVKCFESSSTADAILQMTIRVVSSAGTTVRGTLYAGQSSTTTVTTVGAINQEFGTTANAGTRIFSGLSLSSVSAQAGDRIVIELGWRACNVSGAAVASSLHFGDLTADADHALVAVNNATTSPDLSPWVEFSEDLFTVPNITVTANPAAETDTAQTLARSKRRALGINAETDAAQALGRRKSVSLGITAETEAAQPLARVKRYALGIAAETDSARAIGHPGALVPATETDTAQPISVRKVRALGAATETGAAQALAHTKYRTLGIATEADAASAIISTMPIIRALGTATETDAAQTIVPDYYIGPIDGDLSSAGGTNITGWADVDYDVPDADDPPGVVRSPQPRIHISA